MGRSNWTDVHGVLVLDKPSGMSSNQALQTVRRLLRARKGGHTGNLDPLATGVLPLCFGEATKYSQILLDAEKTYVAQARLGIKTDSGDSEGAVIETAAPGEWPQQGRFHEACLAFTGEIDQIPPMYSALKHQGKRLYEIAREGGEVERPARRVHIRSLEPLSWEPPEFSFRVACSKGTYVRTLIEDVAAAMGLLAHMTALRREQSGPFSLEQSVTLEQLEAACETNEQPAEFLRLQGMLLPVDQAVQNFPRVTLENSLAGSLICGQAVTISGLKNGVQFRVYASDGRFLGVAVAEDESLKPVRLISTVWLQNPTPGISK